MPACDCIEVIGLEMRLGEVTSMFMMKTDLNDEIPQPWEGYAQANEYSLCWLPAESHLHPQAF